jgi:hypothetical protein
MEGIQIRAGPVILLDQATGAGSRVILRPQPKDFIACPNVAKA